MKIDGILGSVIGLLIGAAGGATVGYLVSEKKFMKKLNEELSKNIQIPAQPASEEQKTEENKTATISDSDKKQADEIAALYKSAVEKAVTEFEQEKATQQRTPATDIDYSGFSSTKKKETKADPVTERRKMRSADKPYVITEEEFDNTFPEFLKMGNVLYYTESHELVDDDDDTILDIDATVGLENVVDFPDSGCRAIRNESIATDYLVTFVDGSYSYMN